MLGIRGLLVLNSDTCALSGMPLHRTPNFHANLQKYAVPRNLLERQAP